MPPGIRVVGWLAVQSFYYSTTTVSAVYLTYVGTYIFSRDGRIDVYTSYRRDEWSSIKYIRGIENKYKLRHDMDGQR